MAGASYYLLVRGLPPADKAESLTASILVNQAPTLGLQTGETYCARVVGTGGPLALAVDVRQFSTGHPPLTATLRPLGEAR
jgi:hypothetical protein